MRETAVISTSGLKYDVNIVFLETDFFLDAEISAIWPEIRVILRIFSLCTERGAGSASRTIRHLLGGGKLAKIVKKIT